MAVEVIFEHTGYRVKATLLSGAIVEFTTGPEAAKSAEELSQQFLNPDNPMMRKSSVSIKGDSGASYVLRLDQIAAVEVAETCVIAESIRSRRGWM